MRKNKQLLGETESEKILTREKKKISKQNSLTRINQTNKNTHTLTNTTTHENVIFDYRK